MKKIKLFITDIDGVWTDGGMYYGNDGTELKKFNTSDSAGVLFLKLLDIPLAIITGENTAIVKRRAEKLGIPYLFMGVKNKLRVARQLCEELEITLEDTAYIGDDINDVQLLRHVGLSAAPANAPEYVQSEVNWVIPITGGNGAFRAFVEQYLNSLDLMPTVLEKYFEQLNFEQ